MLTKLRIKNFKSIIDDTIELGAVNVFIGENGCGKTNILEALGFLSCWAEGRLDTASLSTKGIRLAKPEMMMSCFSNHKNDKHVDFEFKHDNDDYSLFTTFSVDNTKNEFWKQDNFLSGHLYLIHNGEKTRVSPEMMPSYAIEKFSTLATYYQSLYSGRLSLRFERAYIEFEKYLIYAPTTPHLRGIVGGESKQIPLGIFGEGLDETIATLNKTELEELKSYGQFISWLSDFTIDIQDILKLNGLKANRGTSRLYFKDKFMKRGNNLFSAENANEGVLYLLFYLTLLISNRTPKIFAIDNIESALNPHLCTKIMEIVSELTIKKGKQALITTHNPAILDGLDLNDDRVRLFEVYRDDKGGTRTRRIKTKPDADQKYKLSELWMRGYLGAISKNF
jgi:predicted ATPase